MHIMHGSMCFSSVYNEAFFCIYDINAIASIKTYQSMSQTDGMLCVEYLIVLCIILCMKENIVYNPLYERKYEMCGCSK